MILKSYEKSSKNQPENCRFFSGSFMELPVSLMKPSGSLRFFETTETNGSLILKCFFSFKELKPNSSSLILNYLKEPELVLVLRKLKEAHDTTFGCKPWLFQPHTIWR
jgi:hypothetical protein